MQSIDVQLGPVQKTLLIPLYGRALETHKEKGILKDPKAVEMVNSLDFDFTAWKKLPLAGVSVRTRIIDDMVSQFLRAHPEGTIIEIGAGLNTRYERLDNGQATWIELDLPDSMALRRQFFTDTDRRTMIAASALDGTWHEAVAKTGGPYCFISEAVLIYLESEAVRGLVQALRQRFPTSWFITDTCSAHLVANQGKNKLMKTLPKSSWFRWACDDPKALESWGLDLKASLTYLDASKDVVEAMPWMYRLMTTYAPWLIRKQVSQYRLNQFTLVPNV